jgi:hypothetical protein
MSAPLTPKAARERGAVLSCVDVAFGSTYQAQSEAITHPDRAAGDRIITATNLVLDLLAGYTTPQVVAAIPQIQDSLAKD